jgi:hypothetical protein
MKLSEVCMMAGKTPSNSHKTPPSYFPETHTEGSYPRSNFDMVQSYTTQGTYSNEQYYSTEEEAPKSETKPHITEI